MPSRLLSRCTVFVLAAALLLVPATLTVAAPATDDRPVAAPWQQVWNLFADLFADWFGQPAAGGERATAGDSIGSLLDPDGYAFNDPDNARGECDPSKSECGEIGSLLDPDG